HGVGFAASPPPPPSGFPHFRHTAAPAAFCAVHIGQKRTCDAPGSGRGAGFGFGGGGAGAGGGGGAGCTTCASTPWAAALGIALVFSPSGGAFAGGAAGNPRPSVVRHNVSACFKSPPFGSLLAGSFSSDRLRMNSKPSGASGQSSLNLGGASNTIALTTCPRLRSRAEKGCRPVANWKNTIPAENASDAAVHRSPRICSGDI